MPVTPDRLDWPSMIGNFLLNFGMLDLLVQDFLEDNLNPTEFRKWRDRGFQDRVDRLKKLLEQSASISAQRPAICRFFAQVDRVREFRNHIAHGVLRLALAEDQKGWIMTVTLPRDLSGSESPDPMHVTFDQLLDASKSLTESVEDFQRLFGNWVTDVDVTF